MTKHLLWVWLWYFLGVLTYWIKRAYYLITGPNPVANNASEFIRRCWAPLLVRAFLESLFFWVMFDPRIAGKLLAYFGWTSYEWAVSLITQVAPVSGFLGHAIDSLADFAVSKVPFVKDILPQMPGPLPPAPPPPNAVRVLP